MKRQLIFIPVLILAQAIITIITFKAMTEPTSITAARVDICALQSIDHVIYISLTKGWQPVWDAKDTEIGNKWSLSVKMAINEQEFNFISTFKDTPEDAYRDVLQQYNEFKNTLCKEDAQ